MYLVDKFIKTQGKVKKLEELERKFYTVREVAKILRFSPSTVYKFIKNGKIKAMRFGTGRFRIPKKELNRLLR